MATENENDELGFLRFCPNRLGQKTRLFITSWHPRGYEEPILKNGENGIRGDICHKSMLLSGLRSQVRFSKRLRFYRL